MRPTFTGPFPIIAVTDIEASAAFCRQAFGFAESFRWPPEPDQPAAFMTLALDGREIGLGTGDTPVTGMELCLEVNDIHAAWQWLMEMSATPLQEPTVQPWGESNAYIADPDGLRIHLYCRHPTGSSS